MAKNSSAQTAPITVRVPGASYPIFIEDGLLAKAGERLTPLIAGRKVFILSDSTIWKLWGKQLLRSLLPIRPAVILVPAGEQFKSMTTVEQITEMLSAEGAERSSLLLCFGGGVVGDMGGFAASVYLRGMDCVQIPTTLLAQVDSAIGGKTGVNLGAGKNLVGTFHQPKMVLSDPLVLRTLPEREVRAGLYEAVKCAVIGDPELFEFLDRNRGEILKGKSNALARVIHASAALKARVVSADEKEGDLRRILNYGHTVGHALEAATGYRRFLHGEAVAWGMLAANRLAMLEDGLPSSEAARIDEMIRSYGPVPSLGRKLDPAVVFHHMAADKKVRDGKIHFVLPRRIGEVKISQGIAEPQVMKVLKDLMQSNPFRG